MITVEGSRSLRVLVLVALSAATAGMFLVSMRANYLYGRSIGQSPETQVAIAWANVGADIWKAFGLIVVAALWRARWRRAASAAFCAWAICLCFSVTSAIGIYVQERSTLTGGRLAQQSLLEEVRAELAALEARIRTRGTQPTPAEIEAAIGAVLARPVAIAERIRGTVASISASCTRADPRTATPCAEIASLQRDLVSSRENVLLEERLAGLRDRIRELQNRGAALPADPVAQFWTWLSGGWLTTASIAYGMPLFFALMIEFVSTFGPVGIAAYAEATRRDTARHGPPVPAAARRDAPQLAVRRVGSVIDYVAERTEPSHPGKAIGLQVLNRDYVEWCVECELDALDPNEFGAQFDAMRSEPELAGRIRKFGTRYYGIKLVDGVRTTGQRAVAGRTHNIPLR